MASLSSTSVSSSSSLGNTSLRGFGGMASGIDRDAIIEQMTLGTNTKIESQKSNMTKLQWKQEAYRGITDQILDLTDKYASYSSTSNLKDPGLFSKSLVTVQGPESASRFVTATGTSKLVENIAITAVKQLATATVRQSKVHDVGTLKTRNALDLDGGRSQYSKLEGTTLKLGYYDDYNKKFVEQGEFKFESSYTITNSDGSTTVKKVNYLAKTSEEIDELIEDLNNMATDKGYTINFTLENDKIKISNLESTDADKTINAINGNSSALSALGYESSAKSIRADGVDGAVAGKDFSESFIGETSTMDGLVGKNLIFEYNGIQKSVQLLTRAEADQLKKIGEEKGTEEQFNAFVEVLQGRLDQAFGKGAIEVGKEKTEITVKDESGNETAKTAYKLTFKPGRDDSAVSILSNDSALLNTLGLDFGESNKVNVDGKLGQAALGLDANAYTDARGQLNLKINGVSITGLTADSTISDIVSKINSTTAAGVKATYVEATGKFMLVTNETGAGREISLDSELAEALFGGYEKNENGSLTIKYGGQEVEAKWNESKGYYQASVPRSDGTTKTIRLDEYGNRLNKSGQRVDKDGNLINEAGYRVNESGKLIDQYGQLIDKNGYLVDGKGQYIVAVKDDGTVLDHNQYLIKEQADGKQVITDLEGNSVVLNEYNIKTINKDGHFIDEKGRLTDINGALVDKDGNYINEENQYLSGPVTDSKSVRIDSEGYKINKRGNYEIKNGDKNVFVARGDDGKYYQVDEDGYCLETDNTNQRIVKTIEGEWRKIGEDGKIIDGDEGKSKGPQMINISEEEFLKNRNQVRTGLANAKDFKVAIKSGDSPVPTTGAIHAEAYKAEIISKESIEYGQNAKIQVSYGNGVAVDMERSSNTFNLEGLTVTVSGTFGGKYEDKVVDGETVQEWTPDSSQTVTFSAKADVDKALETVKAFFEDFNALVTEINSQITARPDSNYGPLTSAQKEEMDETSIENWEKKAKQGILFNDDVMRDLSGSMEGVLSKLMNKYGVNYQDLEKIGITYSEDYLDGGTLVFDESKFRSAMESDPELVSKIISGGESGGKGLIHVVEDSLTPYATRYASKNGNSYGRLIEVAGTEKKPTTLMSNQIYKQLKEMQETIDKLQAQLKVEQDRYISQFTTMESLINQMNTQSSYLSQIMA